MRAATARRCRATASAASPKAGRASCNILVGDGRSDFCVAGPRRPGAGQGLAAQALPRDRSAALRVREFRRGHRSCWRGWLEERGATVGRPVGAAPSRPSKPIKSRSGMHKPIQWPDGQRSAPHGRRARAVGSGAAGARGQVLLARRHGALHQPAEDLRSAARARSSSTPRGATFLDLQMWYSAVNFGYRNERLERRRAPPARPAAAGGEPVSAPREDRACRPDRPGCRAQVRREGPRALQRRRQPGGRGQPQARAQLQEGQEPDVRVRGRLSRPHARRLRHHLVLPLPPALRPLRRPRAVRAVPLSLPRAQGHDQGGVRPPLRASSSSACSRASTTACGTPRWARPSTPPSTSSRSRAPAATSFRPRTSSSS